MENNKRIDESALKNPTRAAIIFVNFHLTRHLEARERGMLTYAETERAVSTRIKCNDVSWRGDITFYARVTSRRAASYRGCLYCDRQSAEVAQHSTFKRCGYWKFMSTTSRVKILTSPLAEKPHAFAIAYRKRGKFISVLWIAILASLNVPKLANKVVFFLK